MTAWLELFYDLVFVAAILVLSSAVSHVSKPERVTWVVLVFGSLWWIWLQTTLFTNRFGIDDMTHRLLVLVQMFLVIVVAMEAHEGVIRDGEYLSLTYAALMGTVAIMYVRASRSDRPHARYARRGAAYTAASAAIFALAAVAPGFRGVVWLVAFVPSVAALPWGAESSGAPVLDEHHLLERMGALTIIVCGEAFVKVAIAVSSGAVQEVDIIALAFQFVLTFAIWLTYFEDIPQAGVRFARLPAWIALHFALQLGIAGTAIGVARFVNDDPLHHVPPSEILEIMAALAAVYLALALLGPCTRRVPVRPLLTLRLATCAVVLLVGFAGWLFMWTDLAEDVAALTVVAIAHAVVAVYLEADTRVLDPA